MTARSPEATAVVLETFRTYYAAFRAVNLSFHALTQGAPALNPAAFVLDQHSLGVDLRRRGANAQHAAPVGFATIFARKGTGAFEFVKDLVLEVPRFPLTCRRTLSPTSSPVARAATTKLYVLDAGFFCRTQNPSRIRRRQ